MNSRNTIWLLIPIVFIFSALWIFEPIIYQALFASSKLKKLKNDDFLVIAHRGGAGLAPENTMAAFERSLSLGVDMIEVDVHLSSDNEVVVIHDELVERTTDGTGLVHEMSLEELKSLDAGSWFSEEFSGQTIPTLDQVLTLINGRAECLIEIKSKEHIIYKGFAERIIDLINAHHARDWCIVQSYEEEYLEAAYDYDPKIMIKRIIMGEEDSPLFNFFTESKSFVSSRNKHHYLETLNPHYLSLSQRRIHKIKARGYKVITYPVNEREDMVKMLNMGVDGIITDYPDRLVAIKEELEKLK